MRDPGAPKTASGFLRYADGQCLMAKAIEIVTRTVSLIAVIAIQEDDLRFGSFRGRNKY